jgi:pimeloyl-ACP methyl ester carboxylesterase
VALKLGINYELFNLQNRETIIFLHGWGSNKEVMKVFKDSFSDYKLLFIDLPGFGKSETDEIWDTKKYADKLTLFLEELNIEKFCIVGHSFGGKVATLLNPKYLILLSSAGILQPKPFKIRFKIKLFKLFKPFLRMEKIKQLFISDDVKEMKQNMYETFKNVVDEDFSEIFQQCTSKSLVFGGENDTAVTPNSNKRIGELLNCPVNILNGNHYFFLDKINKLVIVSEIKTFLKENR